MILYQKNLTDLKDILNFSNFDDKVMVNRNRINKVQKTSQKYYLPLKVFYN